MNYDLYSNVSVAASLVPQVATTTGNGASVDTKGFESATVVLNLGNFGGTSPTATVKVQDSADASTWADVAAADLIGGALPALTGSNDNQVYRRGYRGFKRYLRVIISAAGGTSPTLPISASVILGHARANPVT